MKIRFFHARLAMAAVVIMCFAACGGQPARDDASVGEAVPPGNYFIGDTPVYGHLVSNKDGSWVFKTVTASDAPSDTAYLVRLNDLTPAFDIRVAECVPQVYPESHRCNPANPFRDEDSGVLDKIINGSIAVGTAGQITDITYAYETTFDETDFNRAVDEALLNTGLDRHRLISTLTTYEKERDLARAELASAEEQAQSRRADAAQVDIDVQPTIGGLVEYYQGDIDFTQLIDLELAEDGAPQTPEIDEGKLLPCEARQCVASADAALQTLRRNAALRREHLSAGTRSYSRTFDVRCDMVGYGDYLIEARCPDQVVVNDGQEVVLNLDVTVLSRDFNGLYPDFELDDRNLRIDIDGREVTFSNSTSEYLTVSAQTVYYNSRVHTTGHAIDIPPGISVTRDLGDFVSQPINIESSYRQMTPDKAAGASFRFGFAVRYQVASQTEERTLHEVDTFNVGCVISNRLRPGSCRPQAVADSRDSSGSPRKPVGPM